MRCPELLASVQHVSFLEDGKFFMLGFQSVHFSLLLFWCMSKLVATNMKSRLECRSEKSGRFNIEFTPTPVYEYTSKRTQ